MNTLLKKIQSHPLPSETQSGRSRLFSSSMNPGIMIGSDRAVHPVSSNLGFKRQLEQVPVDRSKHKQQRSSPVEKKKTNDSNGQGKSTGDFGLFQHLCVPINH